MTISKVDSGERSYLTDNKSTTTTKQVFRDRDTRC